MFCSSGRQIQEDGAGWSINIPDRSHRREQYGFHLELVHSDL